MFPRRGSHSAPLVVVYGLTSVAAAPSWPIDLVILSCGLGSYSKILAEFSMDQNILAMVAFAQYLFYD